jgi:HPt (histidine-containing phosphotransfer) domain-containing protein
MDDYLSKPVQRVDLKQVLDRWGEQIASDGRGLRTVDFEKLKMLGSLAEEGAELIAEVRDLFLEESTTRLAAIAAAARSKDATTLWKEAHALKSGCGNVGAERLAAICLAIERRGRSGAIDGSERLVDQLPRELARVRSLMQELSF